MIHLHFTVEIESYLDRCMTTRLFLGFAETFPKLFLGTLMLLTLIFDFEQCSHGPRNYFGYVFLTHFLLPLFNSTLPILIVQILAKSPWKLLSQSFLLGSTHCAGSSRTQLLRLDSGEVMKH